MSRRVRVTAIITAAALAAVSLTAARPGDSTAPARPARAAGQGPAGMVRGQTARTPAQYRALLGPPSGPALHPSAVRTAGQGPAGMVRGQTARTPAQYRALLGPPSEPALHPSAVRTGTGRSPDFGIVAVLEGMPSGILVVLVTYVAKNPRVVFKWALRYILRRGIGKHTYLVSNPPDHGTCGAILSSGADMGLGNSCTDKHGIYWEESDIVGSGTQLVNTDTGNYLYAFKNQDGQILSGATRELDWHTWGYGDVCKNTSCSELYGVYWALKNSQAYKWSDNDR